MTTTESQVEFPRLTPETYINRELGTLAFQRRVLAMATDDRVPLLERVKFVAIVGSNLDEFFMVRVPSYLQKIQTGITRTRPDGYTPAQLIRAIRDEVADLFNRQIQIKQQLFSLLEDEGIVIRQYDSLSRTERQAVYAYFEETIFPVLTPLAVDHARPFPFISNLSLNLGVYLERESAGQDEDTLEFARIKLPVPDILPRLVNLNAVMANYADAEIDGHHFLWIEDVVANNLDMLFPGMRVLESSPFRVLRNADIDYEHEADESMVDVMSIIEQSVRERRFGQVVRLSVPIGISDRMLKRLTTGLELRESSYVYTIDGSLGSSNLFQLASVDRPDLKYPPYAPRSLDLLSSDASIFDAIAVGDFMLHLPYDSFNPVEQFFREAARDPNVLAIKSTLYRVGRNSPVVDALMQARDNEKQVTVLVELKARFDEENNLEWARQMEAKGVHVIYGVEELPVKTHAKTALVVRREGSSVRRYLHLGTGNYNASTARLYEDIGLFTCDPILTDDASRLFNRLTGYAPQTAYRKLVVAPEFMLDTFLSLIDNEIAAARAGKDARIIMKMNQLEEDRVIERLYAASQAGVKIDLIVRGFCSLRPGVPGVSENIHVRSIIGRFLEHSRIFYFQNAPDEQRLLAGSADIMRRNLYNRVEVVFPVLDERLRTRLLHVLATNLVDNVGAWVLQPDGAFVRLEPGEDETAYEAQTIFMQSSFGLNRLP